MTALGLSGMSNVWLARKDFGFSGPTSWRNATVILAALFALNVFLAPPIGALSTPDEFHPIEDHDRYELVF